METLERPGTQDALINALALIGEYRLPRRAQSDQGRVKVRTVGMPTSGFRRMFLRVIVPSAVLRLSRLYPDEKTAGHSQGQPGPDGFVPGWVRDLSLNKRPPVHPRRRHGPNGAQRLAAEAPGSGNGEPGVRCPFYGELLIGRGWSKISSPLPRYDVWNHTVAAPDQGRTSDFAGGLGYFAPRYCRAGRAKVRGVRTRRVSPCDMAMEPAPCHFAWLQLPENWRTGGLVW